MKRVREFLVDAQGWQTLTEGPVPRRYLDNSFGAVYPTSRPFYRSDLNWWVYYDGTRWLTCQEFSVNLSVYQTAISANAGRLIGSIRTDYAPYFTRTITKTRVDTTNDATNYWNVSIRGVNAALSAATVIYNYNTSGHTVAVITDTEAAPGTPNPTNRTQVEILVTKTNAPGNMNIFGATAYYRLIVT